MPPTSRRSAGSDALPGAISNRIRQAATHLEQGHPQQARQVLMQELQRDPSGLQVNRLMRHVMSRLGEHEQGLYYAQKALKADPDNPDMLNLVANSLIECGRLTEAEAVLRRALELRPEHEQNTAALASLLSQASRFVEAMEVARAGLDRFPHNFALANATVSSMVNLGQIGQAAALLHGCVTAQPGNPILLSRLCGALNYLPSASPQDVLAAHLAFGNLLENQVPRRTDLNGHDFDPDRPLRIGVLAMDFRDHAFQYFAAPLLEHFDYSRDSLHIFQHAPEDAVTQRLRQYAGPRWQNTSALQPIALAEKIRESRIDVLIDGVGHTVPWALMAMHLKPAPVQAAWLNYPSTTGVRAIDWRIVDSLSEPEGTDASGSERLWRLDPCAQAYRPPADMPGLVAPPSASAQDGAVTFGSFSAAPKINDSVVRLWARVLRETPSSRMLIKNHGLAHESCRAAMLRRFELAGVSPGRLTLLPPTPAGRAHLETYNLIDIALDTHPYPAITTVYEAMVMGVPLVTMTGRTSVSRATAPMLHLVGLGDLVTADEDAFVAAAAALARDTARRASLRGSLRAAMLASPLCDEPAWARRFTDALRQMWRIRCAEAARRS